MSDRVVTVLEIKERSGNLRKKRGKSGKSKGI